MKQCKIDGVLYNYEIEIAPSRPGIPIERRWPKDPSIFYRIFTCPADRRFARIQQHEFPLAVTKLKGKFKTNGHEYDFGEQ